MVDRLDIMTSAEVQSTLKVNRQRVTQLTNAGLIRRITPGVYEAQSVLDYKNARDSKDKPTGHYKDLKRYNNG